MATIRIYAKDDSNTAIEGAKVVVKLVTSSGNAPGYPGGGAVLAGPKTQHSDNTGLTSWSLTANASISPAGTAYKYEIYLPGSNRPKTDYFEVPTGSSTYDVEDVLSDPPESLETPALTQHRLSVADHGDVDVTGNAVGKVLMWDGTNWSPADTVATDLEAAALVAAEAALRTTADTNEAIARAAADTALSDSIAAETTARIADVNAEETARSDADAALQTAVDARQALSEKGVADGYAGLGSDGFVPDAQLNPTLTRDAENDKVVNLAETYGLSPAATAADNTAALKSAIEAGNTAYLAGAGVTRLYAPAGVYMIQKSAAVASGWAVKMLDGIELFGDGEGKTIFKVTGVNLDTDGYQSVWCVKGASGASLLKDVYLHDFTTDGNKGAMTGTVTANSMDMYDYRWCARSVKLERLTAESAVADGFDVDDSTGVNIRNCSAYRCNGWGFHNSENNVALVQIGNYAEDCGATLTRGGFDQFSSASNGVYLGCVGKSNYRNFDIQGSGASAWGCRSISGTNPDVILGLIAGTDPVDGKLITHGAAAGLRLGDQADTSLAKRWLAYVTGGALKFFSATLGADVLSLSNTGNAGLNTTQTGSGQKVFALGEAAAVPSTNPVGAAIVYVEGGVIKYRKPSGGIVTVGETAERQALKPTAALAETFPRGEATIANIPSILLTGRLQLYGIFLRAGMLISNITFWAGTTAISGASNQWFSLYSLALAKLAVTADDTNTAWAGGAEKTLAVAAPYTVPTDGFYYLGIMVVATTMPSLQGLSSSGSSTIMAKPPIIAAASTTGLTNPASAPDPAGALTATGTRPYAYVS